MIFSGPSIEIVYKSAFSQNYRFRLGVPVGRGFPGQISSGKYQKYQTREIFLHTKQRRRDAESRARARIIRVCVCHNIVIYTGDIIKYVNRKKKKKKK